MGDGDELEHLELRANGLRFDARACGHGPLVVCLHGFPDHSRSFRHQLPALAAAGYRVVAPTMRGYQPSAQPEDGRYFIVDLASDVLAWLDALDDRPVHLVGHDWGAVVAYAVAQRAPQRLRSLVTIAVPQLRRLLRAPARLVPVQLRKSWYMGFFQLPGVPDWAVARDHGALITKLWRDWSPTWTPPADELAAVQATFAAPGVRAAALAYYRCNLGRPGPAMLASWRSLLQRTRVPTLSVTGAVDGCMDTRLFDHGDWRDDYEGPVELLRVANGGHFVHQEQPERVNAALLAWLARWPRPPI